LASNGHTDKNNTTLLDAYQPEEIHSQYVIRIARKDYIMINYLSEVYRISNTHKYYRELKGFTEKVIELVREPYSKFIDNGLPKTYFNLQLLESAKEGYIKRLAIASVKNGFQKLEDYLVQLKFNYSVIWLQTFLEEKLIEKEFKPIDNEDAIVKGTNLVIEKYG
ncbi:2520_t:CDS:2, partial [Scutellospora calospora]